jgi:hypothetical protein
MNDSKFKRSHDSVNRFKQFKDKVLKYLIEISKNIVDEFGNIDKNSACCSSIDFLVIDCGQVNLSSVMGGVFDLANSIILHILDDCVFKSQLTTTRVQKK